MRKQIVFKGRVQGVGFRFTADSIARRYPITGFVRNQPDGTVLLEAQGKADDIEHYLDALRAAMIGNIVSENDAVVDDQSDQRFDIRR